MIIFCGDVVRAPRLFVVRQSPGIFFLTSSDTYQEGGMPAYERREVEHPNDDVLLLL